MGIEPATSTPGTFEDVGRQVLGHHGITHPVQAIVEYGLDVLLVEMGKDILLGFGNP